MADEESRPTSAKVEAASVSSSNDKTGSTVEAVTDGGGEGTLRRDLHFAQIPEWVLYHPKLSPQAVRLYCVLVRYAEGRCWPSRATLARQLHVKSVDTVDRALRELVEISAVTVTRRISDAGDPTSSSYTVHSIPPEGVAARMRPPRRTDAGTGSRTEPALTRATSNQTPNPHSGCAVHAGSPRANCRACRTNPRAVQGASQQEQAALERERDRAARAAAARSALSSTDPKVQEQLAHVRDELHQARACKGGAGS